MATTATQVNNADGNGLMETEQQRSVANPATVILYRVLEYGLLILVAYYSLVARLDPFESKLQTVSALGYFLPGAMIGSASAFLGVKVVNWTLLGLWLLSGSNPKNRNVFLIAPIVFCLLMSLSVETQYFVRHQPNFCVVGFFLVGLARFFQPSWYNERSELPPWVYFLFVYFLGVSYTYSAVCKIWYSGWNWANGSSLMFWVENFSRQNDSWLFQLLTENLNLAWLLQWTTLVAEGAAVLMIFWPRCRVWIGLTLVGFHVSIEMLFGFGFYANIFLDSLILVAYGGIPEYRWTVIDFWKWATTPLQQFGDAGSFLFSPAKCADKG